MPRDGPAKSKPGKKDSGGKRKSAAVTPVSVVATHDRNPKRPAGVNTMTIRPISGRCPATRR